MRVLHINSEKSWRGGEQQMASLMTILREKGVESALYGRKNSEAVKRLSNQNFETFEASFGGLNFFNSLNLKKVAANYDIVHTHTANGHTVAYQASLFGLKTPLVVSKRTDFPVKSPGKFNHDNVKRILCVSNKIKEITQESVQNPNRVVTVYSGIDTKRFDGEQKNLRDLLQLPSDSVLVGNCSALAPHKDYFSFIDVAKNFPQFQFVIIGDGPLENDLKEYGKNLKNLHFTGFLKNIECYLKSLNYFLMTSDTEGLGTSLLDAMICRVPIVSTRAGGIPEIVIEGETGLLADIKSVDNLSQQLERMSQDLNLKQLVVENAYQNVLNNFSRENTALKTLEIYNSLLL